MRGCWVPRRAASLTTAPSSQTEIRQIRCERRTVEGRQTNDDRRWTDEQTQSRRQTDREKTDRLTDGQTGRKQSELS